MVLHKFFPCSAMYLAIVFVDMFTVKPTTYPNYQNEYFLN